MWPRTGEHSINILLSKQLQIISSISLLRRQLRSTASKNQTQHLTVNRWLSIRGDMKNWKIYAKMRLYISVHRHHLLVLILCVQPTLLGRPAPLRWVNAEDIKAVLMKINTISWNWSALQDTSSNLDKSDGQTKSTEGGSSKVRNVRKDYFQRI